MGIRGAWVAGVVAFVLGTVCAGGGWPGEAIAGEGPAPGAGAAETPAQAFARVEATVKAHLRDKDADALKADCVFAREQGTSCEEAALRPKYRALLGAILQGSRDDEVRKVALKEIGEVKDPALFKYVRPFLAMPDAKRAGDLLLPAIETTGRLAADDGAQILVGLVKDAKVMDVARAALKALSGYGGNKRVRAKVVGDVIATVRKDRPGIGNRPDYSNGKMEPTARVRTGDESESRWQTLAPQLVETLNQMTGQNVGRAEDWFDLYDRYKGQPGVLFPKETGT